MSGPEHVAHRILVVGDELDLRRRLAEELGPEAPVLFAESGADALALLVQMPEIEVVITALALRGPVGAYDVFRADRQRRPAGCRVLVTDRRVVVLDHDTSPLVSMVFGRPWIPGTIRSYLRQRSPT